MELSGVGYCEKKGNSLSQHTGYTEKDRTYSTQYVQNAGSDFEMREGVRVMGERGQPFLREREVLCFVIHNKYIKCSDETHS